MPRARKEKNQIAQIIDQLDLNVFSITWHPPQPCSWICLGNDGATITEYKEEIVRVFQERLPWAITHPMAMDFQRIFSDVLPTLIHPKSHVLAVFKIVENLVPHKWRLWSKTDSSSLTSFTSLKKILPSIIRIWRYLNSNLVVSIWPKDQGFDCYTIRGP